MQETLPSFIQRWSGRTQCDLAVSGRCPRAGLICRRLMLRRQCAGWTLAEILQPKSAACCTAFLGRKAAVRRAEMSIKCRQQNWTARPRQVCSPRRPSADCVRSRRILNCAVRTNKLGPDRLDQSRSVAHLQFGSHPGNGIEAWVCVAQKSSKSENRIVASTELVMTPCNPVRSNNALSAVRRVFLAPGVGAIEAPS